MPRFPRLVVPGYPHHVTQRGVRKQTTFFAERDYREYLRLALEIRDDWPLQIWAYCLMPNHIHAVAVPSDDGELSKYFGLLHKKYARRINARYEWSGHLWQKRFYSVVLTERHAYAAMRYVELNPVRAGLCNKAEDWPWSSARANLEITVDPLIDPVNTTNIIDDWATYLEKPEEHDQLQQLRDETAIGRPTGDDKFLGTLETLTGRRIRKRPAGRKKRAGNPAHCSQK